MRKQIFIYAVVMVICASVSAQMRPFMEADTLTIAASDSTNERYVYLLQGDETRYN